MKSCLLTTLEFAAKWRKTVSSPLARKCEPNAPISAHLDRAALKIALIKSVLLICDLGWNSAQQRLLRISKPGHQRYPVCARGNSVEHISQVWLDAATREMPRRRGSTE